MSNKIYNEWVQLNQGGLTTEQVLELVSLFNQIQAFNKNLAQMETDLKDFCALVNEMTGGDKDGGS